MDKRKVMVKEMLVLQRHTSYLTLPYLPTSGNRLWVVEEITCQAFGCLGNVVRERYMLLPLDFFFACILHCRRGSMTQLTLSNDRTKPVYRGQLWIIHLRS